MRNYQISVWLYILPIIFLTGFKKYNGMENNPSKDKSDGTVTSVVTVAKSPKVSIANVRVVKGDKGQRPVKVIVYLSEATTKPILVKYSTEDGSAKAGADYVATKGSITFEPGEVAKWITVLIIGEVVADPEEKAPANEAPEFIVKITEATGVIIDIAKANITIIQNIAGNPSIIGVGANQAVYEVIISFTGYTSFADSAGACAIRKDGVVVLSGLLSGLENVASDDDIIYTGTLEMIMDIDICSVTRSFNDDDDHLCGITVNGSGKVYTELEIYYDGRGGYITIEDRTGQFIRTVTGNCGPEQQDAEWTMVPNKSIASVFNGKDLSKLVSRTLRKGIYTDTDKDGNKTVVEVLRKIL